MGDRIGIRGKEDIPESERGNKGSKLATFRREFNDPDFRRKFVYTMGIYLASLSGVHITPI